MLAALRSSSVRVSGDDSAVARAITASRND
jgi:hypothetical protein